MEKVAVELLGMREFICNFVDEEYIGAWPRHSSTRVKVDNILKTTILHNIWTLRVTETASRAVKDEPISRRRYRQPK